MTSLIERIDLAESLVCGMYKISRTDLFIECRGREFVESRFIVWRYLKEQIGLNYCQIGRRYNKDHTTIIHGVREAQRQPLVVNYQRFITKFRNFQTVENPVDSVGDSCGMAVEANSKDSAIPRVVH